MRKPASLQKGDTIAVVAPSFGIVEEEHAILAQAIKNLEKKGYHVDVLENVFKSDGLAFPPVRKAAPRNSWKPM